jgi:hypothetical protein
MHCKVGFRFRLSFILSIKTKESEKQKRKKKKPEKARSKNEYERNTNDWHENGSSFTSVVSVCSSRGCSERKRFVSRVHSSDLRQVSSSSIPLLAKAIRANVRRTDETRPLKNISSSLRWHVHCCQTMCDGYCLTRVSLSTRTSHVGLMLTQSPTYDRVSMINFIVECLELNSTLLNIVRVVCDQQ